MGYPITLTEAQADAKSVSEVKEDARTLSELTD